MIPTERICWEVNQAIYKYFYDNKKKKIPNLRKLHANFGVSLHVITIIWGLITTSSEQWEYATLSALHLLWTLFYLKTYPTCDVAATSCRTDEKTFRKYTRYMILYGFPKVLPPVCLHDILSYAKYLETKFIIVFRSTLMKDSKIMIF